jgi:ribonuclease P protein component
VPTQRGSRFPKSRRLLKREDFRQVYERGRRLQSVSFSVLCLRRPDGGGPRVGFSVSRALGKAVERNRIRRRMREAVRQECWRLEGPWDLVFHPRRAAMSAPMEALRREVERIMVTCGTS